MAKRSQSRDPFSVKLSKQKEDELANWICDELEAAYNARAAIIQPYGEIDYLHALYEQARSPREGLRWAGAADLSSYIITEKVDAMRARIVRTVMTEPVWVVEGWGKDAQRAPFVEEFHQWQLENERLQSYLTKTTHNALIEGTGVLEVIDRHDTRLVQRLEQMAAQVADDGTTLLDAKNQPQPAMDEQGRPLPAEEGAPVIEAKVSKYEKTRKGPGYRVLSLRDFLFLPGHAADKAELFGYAKRCWKRWPELLALEEAGEYRNISGSDGISSQSDRDIINPNFERAGQHIAEQRERTAEKELWEVLILHDLDEDGLEEWYVATVSVVHRRLLRLRHDDLGLPRYIDLTPFPRPDSVYGYSFAGKLASITEEHAARRNMVADRSTLATAAPIKRMIGALWQPNEQPWGPSAVIDVRSPDEVQPFVVPDVPQSAMLLLNEPLQASERIGGLNDLSSGATTTDDKTLGERQMQTFAAEVRIDEGVKQIQESLETLFLVRHELWIRTLAEQQDGMEAPNSLVRSIEARGLKQEGFDGKFTAQLLRGNFRGKPRGSVDTADKGRLLQAFNGSVQALAGMSQFNPMFSAILQHPMVAKSLLEQWARLYNVQDRQVFLEAANEVMQSMQEQAQQRQMLEQALTAGVIPGQAGPPQLPEQAGGGLEEVMASLPPELAALLGEAGPQGVM